MSLGVDRAAEEERRRASERERSSSYKDFQGKIEKETEKVRIHRGYACTRQEVIIHRSQE